ncbi:MAG: hypothetical protein K6F32_00695 [Bacilli bacterium]|nr:hypothetical protein [Bacilli bacterium]
MTKQIPNSLVYAMDDFIEFTAQAITDITAPFYRGKREEFPIDQTVTAENAFFSTILFCMSREVTPRIDDIQACGIQSFRSSDEIYMRALDIYDLWRQAGLECAILFYCEKMNDIIARNAVRKASAGYALIGDMKSRQKDIYEALCQTDEKFLYRNRFDKTYTL